MPLVSIILPAHNEAEVIDRAIESVRTQTLEDFELIVVDDCSDDGTADIASSYDDPRMEVVRHSYIHNQLCRRPLPEVWKYFWTKG